MIKNMMFRLKEFTKECIRVLKVTKKPNSFEFKTTAKAAALGMLLIGAIGFIIQLVRIIFFGG